MLVCIACIKLLPDEAIHILKCNEGMNSSFRPQQSTTNKSNSYAENESDRHGSNWSDQVLDQQSVTQLSEVSIPAAPTVAQHQIKPTSSTLQKNQQHVPTATDTKPYQQAESLPEQSLQGPQDVAHQRMVASLLAIFLGGLGLHKFYLGLNQAGMILLAIHIGVWFLAMVIGVLTLGLGVLITIPLAVMVSILIALGTFVEGLMYLTKSDQDFEQHYLIEKRPWF